ncbi:ribose ABC transporter [Rhodobacter capsulatus]|uniref:Ribose ABC transporter n=1 Tax=Rhodobacter capsulatus TaxID=1061 RepID=A0A4U1JLX7_RHOCA|nr:RbsD/FucU family protein [Rhodobacter capsulatus]TKD13877.1 ribose ABC transporter [Rhodobacter capsulatus]
MLKTIDPILTADLLYTLRAMGHGDEIVIVDANFPAESCARELIRMPGLSATRVMEAILSVMPLDDFVPEAAFHMEVVGDPTAEQPIFADFRAILAQHEGPAAQLGRVERFDFYARAKQAFAIVATGETRLYGCLILKKGVIRPQA